MNEKLIRKYIIGKVSPEEKVQVMHWIDDSSEHAKEFMKIRKLYDMELWNMNIESTKQDPNQSFYLKHILFVRRALKFAAFIAGVVICAYFWNYFVSDSSLSKTPKEQMQSLYVPAGQRAQLLLADGSTVWLNANSRLTYPTNFNSTIRDVTLSGEGYFSIKHDPSKPFIVHAQGYNIKDIGTEFNIQAYENSDFFETALIKGSVQLSKNNKVLMSNMRPNRRIYTQNGKLYEGAIRNMEHYKWREGLICFNNQSISEIINQLQLIFDIKIQNNSENLKNVRYTGKFRTSDGVEHVLRVLQLSNKFTFKRLDEENKIIIRE